MVDRLKPFTEFSCRPSCGMFSLDAPLQPAIDGFVDPENGEQQHTTHLNNVVMQVHRNTSIQQLIPLLGVHLTHTQDKRRSRAILLLAEVLTRLPELKMNGETTHLLIVFFIERLKDLPSLSSCLKALGSVIKFHSRVMEKADSWLIAESLFALNPPIPTMAQSMRKQTFELLQLIAQMGPWESHQERILMEGFLSAMDGEKDPRNLLLCLNIASELLRSFPSDADLIQSFFQITSCYFPITFKPPPNDPYGITSEQLVNALRSVFVAQDSMAKHVMPMVLDKLSRTTVADMTIDMLNTLGYCSEKYPLNRLLTQFQPVATALYHQILHGDNKAVIQTAASTLRTISRIVSPPSKLPGMQALAWSKFVVFIVQKAMDDLNNQAIDSMVSLRAATVLTGVAAESSAGLSYVLDTSLQFFLDHCATSTSSSQQEAALACVVGLLDCIDVDVDHSSPPFQPYVASLQQTLIRCLDQATSARPQKLCVQGLSKLVLRPPSPLLDEASIHILLDLWTRLVLTHSSADVRQEAMSALRATAMKSAVMAHHVHARCLPPMLLIVQTPTACILSNRSASELLKDVLGVVAELAKETSIFMALLLPLCTLALGDKVPHPYARQIMGAVATILRGNTSNVVCMDYCVLANGETLAATSVVALVVKTLIDHVRSKTFTLDHITPFVEPTADICGLIMQFASPVAQEALLKHILALFLSMDDISPFKESATLEQLQLVPLLAAVLYSSGAAQSVVASDLSTLLPLLFELAQRQFSITHPITQIAVACAVKSIASLLNAMPDTALFQEYMAHLTSVTPTTAVSSPIAYVIQDATKPLALRLSALQIYLYASKAIILRAHSNYVPTMIKFIWSLLGSDIRLRVAEGFHLILDDMPELLNATCHATISPVHRQRTFTMVFPLVTSSEMNMEKRVAMLLVIAHTPQSILLPYLQDIIPLVVDALNLKENPYAQLLGHPALVTFKMCLREDPRTVHAYFNAVFPGLLWQCQKSRAVKDRLAALECLGNLASTKYELIHPYKEFVIKSLLGPLDDHKRIVRQLAVKVRNQWSIL